LKIISYGEKKFESGVLLEEDTAACRGVPASSRGSRDGAPVSSLGYVPSIYITEKEIEKEKENEKEKEKEKKGIILIKLFFSESFQKSVRLNILTSSPSQPSILNLFIINSHPSQLSTSTSYLLLIVIYSHPSPLLFFMFNCNLTLTTCTLIKRKTGGQVITTRSS
jgi:hypothetical protein